MALSNHYPARGIHSFNKTYMSIPYTILSFILFSCHTMRFASEIEAPKHQLVKTVTNINPPKPKNIIFMIGDGMGLTQITAGMYMNGNHLEMERCTSIGLHKSYSANELVTESAAGATAFSIGMKTKNGYLGLDSAGISHTTIMEDASKNGSATGIIVTCSIEHATPAAFYAHQKERDHFDDIVPDLLNSNLNLFIGGGKKYVDRKTKDTLSLVNQLKNKGYLVNDYHENDKTTWIIPDVKKVCYFTADGEPLPYSKGRTYLPIATKAGIDYLNKASDHGFFLMIEGSQIDWGGHANDADYLIAEVLDFDRAVKEALDFAEKDKNTLVLITADHETGGFAINSGKKFGDLSTSFTTKKHTAALIPVYAYGPGAELFSGIYENTEIYVKLKKLMDLK